MRHMQVWLCFAVGLVAALGAPAVWTGHSQWVHAVAFSPDGTQALSGSGDRTLRLWNVSTGASEVWHGHTDAVLSVAFAPDGRHAVSGSADESLRIWDVRTGASRTLRGHSGDVLAVSASLSRATAVSGAADRSLGLWWKAVHAIRLTRPWATAHSAPPDLHVYEIQAFDAAGARLPLSLASPPTNTHAARANTTPAHTIDGDDDTAYHGAPADSARLDADLWLEWLSDGTSELGALELRGPAPASPGGLVGLVLSVTLRMEDGDRLMLRRTISTKQSLYRIDIVGGYIPLEGHSGPVLSVAVSSDQTRLLSGSADRSLRLWHVHTEPRRPLPQPQLPMCVAPAAVQVAPGDKRAVGRAQRHGADMLAIGGPQRRRRSGAVLRGGGGGDLGRARGGHDVPLVPGQYRDLCGPHCHGADPPPIRGGHGLRGPVRGIEKGATLTAPHRVRQRTVAGAQVGAGQRQRPVQRTEPRARVWAGRRSSDIPQPQRPIRRPRQHRCAIGCNRDRQHPIRVAGEHGRGPRADVPQPHGAVVGPGDHAPAVRRERDGAHPVAVAPQRHRSPGADIPQPHRTVAGPRGGLRPVRREGHGRHPVPVIRPRRLSCGAQAHALFRRELGPDPVVWLADVAAAETRLAPRREALPAVEAGRMSPVAASAALNARRDPPAAHALRHRGRQRSFQPLVAAVAVTAVALGASHGAFVAGGRLYAMGRNSCGQLGLGHTGDQMVPQGVVAPAAAVVTAVAVGLEHSAFIAGGALYVMGCNGQGQLGLGDASPRSVPERVAVPNHQDVLSVALGAAHSLFIAGGTLFVMGHNAQGQLGVGAAVARALAPRVVWAPNGHVTTAVAAGAMHSVFVAGGRAFAMGLNAVGQLGLGHNVTQYTPQPVLIDEGLTTASVAAGGNHSALVTSGTRTASVTVTTPVTGTPTATLTPTPSQSASVTGTPSTAPSRTPVTTASASMSITSTVLPTATHSATFTAGPRECGPGAPESLAAPGPGPAVVLAGDRECIQWLALGTGSSALLTRSVRVHVQELRGTVTVHLEGATGNYTRRTYSDVGPHELALDAAPALRLLFRYEPPATAAPSSPQSFRVSLQRLYTASALSITLAALGTAAAVPCVIGLSWRHGRRMAAQPLPGRYWRPRWGLRCVHPRWASAWTEVGLSLGLYALVAGALWAVVFHRVRHPEAPVLWAVWAGAGLAAGGLALGAVTGWRALRDDVAFECPTCHAPASRWRFLGTYFPPFSAGGPDTGRRHKGHTRCLRCCICRQPVVTDRWTEGPVDRPYHRKCWDRTCRSLNEDPASGLKWCQSGALNAAERAHLFAALIDSRSRDRVAELLRLWPDLQECPLPGALSARHYAAQTGNAEMLEVLLDTSARQTAGAGEGPGDALRRGSCCILSQPDAAGAAAPRMECPDAGIAHGPSARSLHITAMEPHCNDLYVFQGLLTYNGRPVYIGHFTGKYVYYFLPQPHGKAAHATGWCLSEYLGDGAPSVRLGLDAAEPDFADPDGPPGPAKKKKKSVVWSLEEKAAASQCGTVTKGGAGAKAKAKESATFCKAKSGDSYLLNQVRDRQKKGVGGRLASCHPVTPKE